MVGDDFFADIQHGFGVNAEFRNLALRFNLCRSKVTTHRCRCPFNLGCTGAELNRCVAVPFDGTLSHNLKFVELKNGYRNLLAVFHEQTGHAHLFCNNA